RRHRALQLRLRLRRVPQLYHHSRRRRALQHRQPLLRARLLQHLLTARWSSLLRSLTTRSASTRTTTVSRCGTVQWRTFSAISRCRDWCLTTWGRSCTSRATTASLGLLQRPRDTRHGVPRCSRRWTRLRRTALGSLLIFFAERAYPGPRASTDSGARHTGGTTLFSCDSGCAEFLGCTTTAGDAAHSSTGS